MRNYSIALFGSSLRTNFDKYSDKDLLIVAESYYTLNQLRKEYECKGYSVSTYTYKKLRFLSGKGSLFIQHLKKESRIWLDDTGKLKSLLDGHKEIFPDIKQVSEAVKYFDFINKIPDSKMGYAWFCDCFYVGLRNYLIIVSAINGNCNFSFLDLVNELLQNNCINRNDVEILRQLRVLKKNYRERIIDELPSKEYVQNLVNIGNKLNLLVRIEFLSHDDFKIIILREIRKSQTKHYFKLRLVEMYYLMSARTILAIDKIICNPQFYALKFKDSDFVNKLVNSIDKENESKQEAVLPLC